MEPAARSDAYVRLLGRASKRHLALIIVVTLTGLLIGLGLASRMPGRYTSTATVLPHPAAGNPLGVNTAAATGTQLTVAMETEAGLVDTPAVAQIASEDLGYDVPGPRDKVVATVPSNTQIIKIAYTSTTPEKARDGARAFADAFLEYRSDVALKAQQVQLTNLEDQARDARRSLEAAIAAAAQSGDPKSFPAQQVSLLKSTLGSLNDRISAAKSLSTAPGSVVAEPALPASRNGLSPIVVVVACGLAGLGLGLLLAFRKEWRSDLVDSSEEYEIEGLPLLAKLPAIPQGGTVVASADPGAGSDADWELAEAYRRIRAGLLASAAPPTVLAVSCVSPDEVAGPVAANLAVSLGRAGYRVALVSADPSDGSAESLLGVTPGRGLSDVLTAVDEVVDLTPYTQHVHGIQVICGGADSAKARERFAGPRLGAVLGALRAANDYVIVVTGTAASSEADATGLACDAALLLLSDAHTTHAQTLWATNRLASLGVTAVGAVSMPFVPRDAADRRGRGSTGRRGDQHADAVESKAGTRLVGTDV